MYNLFMGYYGKTKEKNRALALRKKGLSYSEIQKQVKVSKDTLSRWCRDIALTHKQYERLLKKQLKGAKRGRIIGAKRQQFDRIKRTKAIMQKGVKEVGLLSRRDKFMAGLGLYIGDGYKNDKNVGFTNSNPSVIAFMMNWFRDYSDITEADFRGQIWIHENLDELKARRYWSKITKIPLKQFRKSYIAKVKKNSNKIRKNIHSHGVFAIKVSRAATQRKILGWMSGVLKTEMVK